MWLHNSKPLTMCILTDQHIQLAAAGATGGGDKPPGRDPLKPQSGGTWHC